jgi:hypothetical protein
MTYSIVTEGLVKRYGQTTALDGIDLMSAPVLREYPGSREDQGITVHQMLPQARKLPDL